MRHRYPAPLRGVWERWRHADEPAVEIFSADLDATVEFYRDVLGFQMVRDERQASSAYVALERETVRIGAAGRPDIADRNTRQPPAGIEVVLEVDDLPAEHAEYW